MSGCTTYHNPEVATGQKAFWYPWPYVEGLTIAEAVNEPTFIATKPAEVANSKLLSARR